MGSFRSTQLFGLKSPIIQSPMAGVSTPELAAAVSNAGGLGSIAIGALSHAEARAAIEATLALTSEPFNVNVFCHAPPDRDLKRETGWLEHLQPQFESFGADAPQGLNEIYKSFLTDHDVLALLLELRPAFVSFHFGVPQPEALTALRRSGIRTLANATNLFEARLSEKAGVDGIIAQGFEAGGHRGTFDPDAQDEGLTTVALIQILTQHISLPVIAAGGIMDGSGIKKMLTLGAAGVQLGTAFILCPESAASGEHRRRLKTETDTRFTKNVSGRPARGLINRIDQVGASSGIPFPPAYPLAYDAAKQLNALAIKAGNHGYEALWAGAGLAQCREFPAKKLMDLLLAEINERA